MSAAYDGPYTDELFRGVTIPSQVGIYGDTLGDFRTYYDTKAMAGFVQGVEDAAVKAGRHQHPTLVINGTHGRWATAPAGATDRCRRPVRRYRPAAGRFRPSGQPV